MMDNRFESRPIIVIRIAKCFMTDDPNLKSELTKKCTDVVSQAAEISKAVSEIQETSNILNEEYSKDLHLNLTSLCENTQDLIQREQRKLLELFTIIDSIIDSRETQELTFRLPTREQLQIGFNNFINTPLPIWKSNQSSPQLCGAMYFPTTEKIIPPDSYACIKTEEGYILGYVMGYDPEIKAYHCCDADPDQADPIKELIIPLTDIIPMPTSAPSKRSKANTFSTKTKVLGLWPEDGTFTSVFYKAIVRAPPQQSQGWYKLTFDEFNVEVPEKFIVRCPE